MRVLVIDDEGTVRRSCERILSFAGHEVDCVERGEEALRRLGEESFDAVVLDLLMPGMGGMETLRRISERHRTIPVVVITGYATPEVEGECRRRGEFVWLPKPFGPEELMAALTAATSGPN